jgi:hypothetical protein
MVFEADAEVKFLTSNELSKLTNEYYHAAFADYEGCIFEMSQGAPSITLYFNHPKHVENAIYACDTLTNVKVGNSVLDRLNAYDRQVKEGDRYHLTEDGKDIIKPLLVRRLFGNGGNVNWGNITSEVIDKATANYYQPANAQHLTKVTGIDPCAVCAILFGTADEEGSLDYGIEVKADLSMRNGFGNQHPNYVLSVTKAHNDVISKTYEKLGFGIAGSAIVR